LGIVGSDEVLDLGYQFFDAAEGAAANGLLGDDVEPDFNLIQLGSMGRGEIHLNAGVRDQPALHARMLVRGVVVHDQGDGESLGDVGVDLFEKVQILLMAMAALAPRLARLQSRSPSKQDQSRIRPPLRSSCSSKARQVQS
jgi:hypothetical protein